jgi:hypothetical protein
MLGGSSQACITAKRLKKISVRNKTAESSATDKVQLSH